MSAPQQRSVLITGCSRNGLGYALAVAFHYAGLRVLATARDPARMVGLKDLGIECLRLDVCNEESIRDCVAQVRQLTKRSGDVEGSLDCLVNNAGGGMSRFFHCLFPGRPRLPALFPADEIACRSLDDCTAIVFTSSWESETQAYARD